MRRLLAVTLLVAALFVGGGCATEASPTGSTTAGTPTGPPGTPAGGGAAAGDTVQVCAAARQVGASAVQTYVEELGRMVAAAGDGDSATAGAARERAEAALTGWRTALREQSARTADPQLKTLLTDIGTEVAALGVDVESIDETELDRLQQRLDQLCPR
ncbi:hypothetical protein ACIQH6_25535 [Micromonospora orduensis]|uniref:hypothetical protein n=1 Tax=Micromonospora orduensis TaxID=1420891 RepID=UPI0038192D5C